MNWNEQVSTRAGEHPRERGGEDIREPSYKRSRPTAQRATKRRSETAAKSPHNGPSISARPRHPEASAIKRANLTAIESHKQAKRAATHARRGHQASEQSNNNLGIWCCFVSPLGPGPPKHGGPPRKVPFWGGRAARPQAAHRASVPPCAPFPAPPDAPLLGKACVRGHGGRLGWVRAGLLRGDLNWLVLA